MALESWGQANKKIKRYFHFIKIKYYERVKCKVGESNTLNFFEDTAEMGVL